jgi:hypothetical protein
MKISKIKKPNSIKLFTDNQFSTISDITTELKILKLSKFYNLGNKKLNKDLFIQIKNIKQELSILRKKLNNLLKVSSKYNLKWFNSYKMSKIAAIIQRDLNINLKHLLIINKNNVSQFNLIFSLSKNYRRLLLINNKANYLLYSNK